MQRIDDAIKKLAGDDTDQGRNLAVALKRAIADRKISVDQVLQAFKMSETVMRLLSGVTGAQKIKFAANLFGTFPDPDNPGDFLADVEVGGTRSAYRQLIELSLNPDYNPLETTSHEIWHSLEDETPFLLLIVQRAGLSTRHSRARQRLTRSIQIFCAC